MNALSRERAEFEAALVEWNGDEEKALLALGRDSLPPTAEEVFANLLKSWESRHLNDAYSVLCDYQVGPL